MRRIASSSSRPVHLARITLNRPDKLNAIDHELGLQLWAAFARCQEDASIRAIILAGAGRAFCAGDELGRERAPDEEESLRRRGKIKHYVSGSGRWTSTVRLMRGLSQPVIARIQGYAYGAGFNLALGADFRVMARDAKLATPFIKRGLATGTNLLQQFVGIGKAIEMTMLGEPVEAEEALGLGLVNEVVGLRKTGRGRRALGTSSGGGSDRGDGPDQTRRVRRLEPGPGRGVLAPGLRGGGSARPGRPG